MTPASSRNVARFVGFLLLIYSGYTNADCNKISQVQQFINIPENENRVFMNISEPNTVRISMDATPAQLILLENYTEASSTRWILTVNGTLDAEQVTGIQVSIECREPNRPVYPYRISFRVTDINEFAPVFSKPVYTVSLNEMTPVDTVFFTIDKLASDPDRQDARIIYSVSSSQNPALFGINNIGTAIKTVRRLDYDFQPRQYNLTITAKEHMTGGKTNSSLLIINIQDGDDLNPEFDRPLYNTTVNEGSYSYQVLEIDPPIHAVDGDTGLVAPLEYNITQSVPDGRLFSILGNGSLMINGNLQPETTYSISIRVSQINRSQERYDDAVVLVTVVDVNDHSPIMSATSYTASITENSPAGTYVTSVNATDGDFGLNAAFVFFISTPGSFEVDTEGDIGIVKVAEHAVIDREKQHEYNLQIFAQEVFTSERHSSNNSTLLITVLDVNDNSPQFSTNTYIYDIYKNDTIGTEVGEVNATDADEGENGQIVYTLQHTTSPLFRLDPASGKITVNATLGDDNIGQVYLVIGAEDQALDRNQRRTSVATVIINIQDVDLYAPVFNFTIYDLSVLENQPVNSLLMQLIATDNDNGDTLTYSVIGGNDTFRVDSNSGVLSLIRGLDRESRDKYNQTVQVSDGIKSSRGTISVTVLDVNDNSPIFNETTYTFSVKENAGHMIGNVYATDEDIGRNKQINYTIMSESSFEINQRSGEITTSQDLDYEKAQRHVILVSAVDDGDPARTATVTVRVDVIDVNDNSPRFVSDMERITVMEGKSGPVFTVQAHDADSGVNKVIQYTQSGGSSLFNVLLNGTINAVNPLAVGDNNVTVTAYNTQPYDSSCSSCDNATVTVMIHVSDLNNQPPRFERPTYTETIDEGQVNNPVLRVTATDGDTDSAYNSIIYKVVEGDNVDLIYLSPTTGDVYIFSDVDYDPPGLVRLFNFTVEALNTADNSSKDTTLVTINVNDVNDNAPLFDSAVYRCQVREDTATNSKFGCQVNATDIDSGTNAMFQYSIDQPHSSPFQVNASTGEITLSRTVDYEMTSTYTLTIKAEDGITPGQYSTCEVVMNVTDVNDNPPSFTGTPYTFSIPETSPQGTIVATLSATDPDTNTALTYALVNYTENAFILQDTSGSLGTLIEFNCSADVTLLASVSDGVHDVIQAVSVRVLSVNQFTPQYTDTYRLNVTENASFGHVVGKVEATDSDCNENGRVSYSLIAGNTNQVFKIDSSTGEITVQNSSLLDHESVKEYNLLVRAEDGGRPPRMNFTSVTITVTDVDDAPPVFDRLVFAATVPENSPNGTYILELSANDKDTQLDQLRYGLKSPVTGLSTNTSGTVMVSGILDADVQNNVITATVTVTDGARTAESSIRITIEDVNDNNPVLIIGQKNISVPENADVGQVIVNVTASDKDRSNRGFTYWLTSTDGNFAINVSSGMISVENEFDRREQEYFSVGVHVSDHGIPPRFAEDTLTVLIIDSNHAPVFNESVFTFNVFENASIDSLVGQLAAYDEDKGTSGVIQYSFVSGNQERTFNVDRSSGNITLNKKVDYEHQRTYTISVQATDTSYSPKSATGTVIINVKDIPEAPQWPLPLPVVYMMKAQSCDKSHVTAFSRDITAITNSPSLVIYRLANETDKFSLNNSTGALIAVDPTNLEVGRYYLVLEACNYDYPDLCTEAALTIVVSSDTTLTFCPAFLLRNVLESAPLGYVVADLNTTERDGMIDYQIKEGDPDGIFAIDQSTGVLTLATKLDRERTERYDLLIEAGNGTTTAQAQVVVRVIDVKDTIPTFPLPVYDGEISEGASVGDHVLMLDGSSHLVVTARDWDQNTQLEYSIDPLEDSSNGSFAVNESTGEVTLAKKVNREAMGRNVADMYTFKILANDENNITSTMVRVTILDINDNNPVFDIHELNITIPENTGVGVPVTTVNASDADSVDSGRLSFSLLSPTNAPFLVNTYTGEVTVNGPLDRETLAAFLLVIVVRDSGNRNDTMTIKLSLGDVNDKTPKFVNTTFIFLVEEGSNGINTTMIVSATDHDLDQNSQLTFTILSGNSDNDFRLESSENDGILMVDKALDREASGMVLEEGMGVLQLILQVEDNGRSNRLSSTCIVYIHVTDVNDNSPEFDNIDYTGSVLENSHNNTSVHMNPRLSATDPDNSINGTMGIRYHLETTGVPFRVDAFNGTVYVNYDTVNATIDRETTQKYDLQISAQDEVGQGRRSVTNVTIIVIDANDVIPTFVSDMYRFNVSESAQSLSIVGQVNATDLDVEGTSTIRYDIISGDDFRFLMQRNDILVTGGLDRELRSEYSLNVSAFDGIHSGYTTVNITILDVNDNCPVFSDPVAHYNITENTGNITLGVLTASDADLGVNSEMTFFTNASEIQGIFGLEPDGSLVTMTSLDREATSRYTFPVYVRDHGNPPCVSSATVSVRVLDENDETPVFCSRSLCNNAAINASILEKSPVDSVVALPQVRDGDEGENGRVTFSLVGLGKDLFNIDPTSGLVRVARAIDINQLYNRKIISGNFSYNATFDLTIVAEDHGIEPLSGNVTLHLSVQEINDGAPEFNRNVYNFTIPEEESNYTVGKIQASAKNSTGLALVYSIIEGGQAEEYFQMNSTDGTIRTLVKLDRETRGRYSFAVQVRDGRVPERTAYAVVFVLLSDINDNAPKFPTPVLRVNVKENSPPNNLLLVEATDIDQGQNARVTYGLSSPAGSADLFVLDELSGQLMVNSSLDREKQSSYSLNVTATDSGFPARSSMVEVVVTVLDVNDNQPNFTNTPYIVYVTEDRPQGQPLLDVSATDPDAGLNGQVVFRLQSGEGAEVFQIGALDGKLATAMSLDFETTQSYQLTVMAHDLGTPPLNSTTTITVHVNDTYDTKPRFTDKFYSGTVAVATPIGTPINVVINAGNGNFYFNITEGNDANMFTIDPVTGVISVSGEITTQGQVLLTVMASDRMPVQSSDTTKVHVIITEPDVTFPDPLYDVRIPENTNPPVTLLDLNSSAEIQGLPVHYFFTAETENKDAFTVNRSTGVLICVKSLDREQTAEYKLFIQVALATSSPVRSKRAVGSNIVEVVVAVDDKNDNPPAIEAPGRGRVFGIPSTAAANYLVVHLKAVDTDSGENSAVRFSTAAGSTAVFGVNPTSGEVRSLVAMTSISTKQFSLTVNVTDRGGLGISSTMQLTIKVVTETERFGLVANMQPGEFNKHRQNLIGNLSSVLDVDVQLEAVQPHSEGGKLDLTRSDVYFHGIDPTTGNVVPYSEIQKRVIANQDAINRILGGASLLLPVTPTPTTVPTIRVTREKYGISEAEIAVLVIAGVMFIGSVAAVVSIIKIFNRYEEWHQKQEKARLVRERQRKITEERTVDEGFNETNVDSDTAEPLDLDVSEESGSREFNPGLLLRPTRMSETLRSVPSRQMSVHSNNSFEDQEKVFDFGTETKECDTIVLRNILVSRELDNVLDQFDHGDSTSDSGTGLNDIENDFNGSDNGVTADDEATPTGNVQYPGKTSDRDTNASNTQFASTETKFHVDNDQIQDVDENAKPFKPVLSAPSPPKKAKSSVTGASEKGSVKSNKSKNVRFTSVVTIDPPDSGNSSGSETHPAELGTRSQTSIKAMNPLLPTKVDQETGDLVTWF